MERNDVLPRIARKYNLTSGIASVGPAMKSNRETLGSLRTGAIIGLSLIYVILAFVFASYSRPIIIMIGYSLSDLSATVFGHFVQGFDLTFLSYGRSAGPVGHYWSIIRLFSSAALKNAAAKARFCARR